MWWEHIKCGEFGCRRVRHSKNWECCACSTAAAGQIAKWIARGVSGHRVGLGWDLEYPVDDGGNTSLVENTHVGVFQIAKTGDVYACISTTTEPMAERMAR